MKKAFLARLTYGAPCSTDHKHKWTEIEFEDFLDDLGDTVVVEYAKTRSDARNFESDYQISGDKEKIIKMWCDKSGETFDEPNYLWGYCLVIDDKCYELKY